MNLISCKLVLITIGESNGMYKRYMNSNKKQYMNLLYLSAMTPQDPQAPSPASSFPPSQGQPPSAPSSDQDQQYMDKIRELSGYIEPLKKMLGKMAKEGKQNQQDYNKLCVLLNLLQPNNKYDISWLLLTILICA